MWHDEHPDIRDKEKSGHEKSRALLYQQILKMPIVRNGKQATVGYQPDVWKNWE